MSSVMIQRARVHVMSTRTMDRGSGGLVVYTKNKYRVDDTTTIYRLDENGNKGQAFYAPVTEFQNEDGKSVYAAVFPTLLAGSYKVYRPSTTTSGAKNITVFPGNLAEVSYA